VPPVVDVMETYEMILRDLRNLDDRNAAEDIPDIQKRIQKNALIANMKAFQPNLMQVSFGLH
jgi:spore coat protein CotF